MNTPTPFTTQAQDDYRSTMQAVAEAYVQRHKAEHLDESTLFERTCQHLVNANQVPIFMAERLAYLAMSKTTPACVTVGWDLASGPDKTVLIDIRDGIVHAVPSRILPHRFLSQVTPN
ncbi:hypothetical protein [Pseudomonas sp.]|uniref:hypothetical protein n=1 Tax=Pseudomonas sp. TaxID=306 RepID=UPI002733C644|nr:hypothetical protein [Pseudomonas sp.]MDP2747975.1 hypothetical protein [Pseudomonas sp.]